MSTTLTIRNSTGASAASTPPAQSLAVTSNLLMAVVKSNQPLQQEIQKTAQTMDSFMEQMKQNFATLSQENKLLKEELLREKTRNQESQTALLAQIKALTVTVNTFNEGASATNKRVATLETKCISLTSNVAASQHAHNALRKSVEELQRRFNGHGHDGYFPST